MPCNVTLIQITQSSNVQHPHITLAPIFTYLLKIHNIKYFVELSSRESEEDTTFKNIF